MPIGIVYAFFAYSLWGVFPLYFKAIQAVPASEIMLHRMLWSFVFLLAVQIARRQWAWLIDLRRRPKVLAGFAASALLLSINWFLYVWAVNSGKVLEASLGYFINPLVNVVLGALFLHERLRRGQALAVALAALGVAWLTWQGGRPPWIALTLALSFGAYGLLRKTASLGALEGLTLETLLLMPLTLACFTWMAATHRLAFSQVSPYEQGLLVAAGPLTAIPLLFFAAAARRISLTTLGLMQYIGPTMQFLIAVLVFHEPFDVLHLIGYAAIWSGLIVFSAEGLWQSRRHRAPPVVSPE